MNQKEHARLQLRYSLEYCYYHQFDELCVDLPLHMRTEVSTWYLITTSNDVNGSGITESGYYNNSSSMCVAAVTAATNSTSSGCTNNNNSKARVRDEEHTTKMMMTTTMKMKNNHAFNSMITGFELESMCNITLSNALRQLGSLLVIANNMFSVLNCELQGIADRTNKIKQKIQLLEENVYSFDPKLVSV
uniref:Wiskott-Aldrich syndrome protein family member n=1 Tax=Megaselia scalaris TaxID=36166 RepID=T1H580_MEGSC